MTKWHGVYRPFGSGPARIKVLQLFTNAAGIGKYVYAETRLASFFLLSKLNLYEDG
jgi:hypothetical protein